MKKLTVITISTLFISLFLIGNINGQDTFERTYDLGLPGVTGIQVEQMPDSGYSIVSSNGLITLSNYLIRTDKHGDTLWTKSLPFVNGRLTDLCLTSNEGLLLIGNSYYNNSYVLLMNSNGDTIWSKSNEINTVMATSVIMTDDNNYVISFDSGNQLVKIDIDGNVLWEQQYSGSINQVIQNSNLGLTMIGINDDGKSFLMETDSSGNPIWTFIYEEAPGITLSSLAQNEDGDYMATGYEFIPMYSYQAWVIKVNSQGNLSWSKTIDNYDKGQSICCTYPNRAVITADYGYGSYLVKIDENGDILWEQPYGNGLYDVKITNDNCLIATGYNTNSVYLVKTDQDGLVTSLLENTYTKNQNFYLYPNPSTGLANINFDFEETEAATLIIQNINGQEMKQVPMGKIKSGKYELNCKDFSPGIYFITLKTDSGFLTEKLIIE